MLESNSSFSNNSFIVFGYLTNRPLETILIQSSTVVCLFGSALLLFLIKKRLVGLNSLIKSIMYFMAALNFLSNLTFLICTLVVSIWQFENVTSCVIIQFTKGIRRFGVLISIALISQIRYYIALKTSQSKTYKKNTLKYIIIAALAISLGGFSVTFAIFVFNDMVPLVSICSGSPDTVPEKIPLFGIILLSFASLIVLVNLISDISMLIFIHKRKTKVKPTQLIPWKSTSKKEANDLKVPVHATILSSISFILTAFMIIFAEKLVEAGTILQILIFSLNQLWINLVIPYVMLLKIIKTKKSQPVIPQGLQRHGEDEEDNGNDVEHKNEIKDEGQNVQQSTSKKPQLQIPQGLQRYGEDDDESDINDENENHNQNLAKPNGEIVLDPKTLTKHLTNIKGEKIMPNHIFELI